MGEVRDLDRKKARFFCLDASGRVLWKDREYGDAWWIGIETVLEAILYLHGYSTPELPIHRGVIAVDLETGIRLWGRSDGSFVRAAAGSVVMRLVAPSGVRFLELEAATGRQVREIDPGDPQVISRETAPDEGEIIVPARLSAIQRSFPSVAAAIRQHAGGREEQLQGFVEGRFIVMTVQEIRDKADTERLVNTYLLMIDRETGNAVYRDLLIRDVSPAAPQTFFARNGFLYYVQERATLTALRLSPTLKTTA